MYSFCHYQLPSGYMLLFLWIVSLCTSSSSQELLLPLSPYQNQASQSGTYRNAVARLAIDGNTNDNYYGGSCSLTIGSVEGKPVWWLVYLPVEYCINKVTIVNRQDSGSARLIGANVRVGNSYILDNNVQCGDVVNSSQANSGVPVDVLCGQPICGQYIIVQNKMIDREKRYVSMCELLVYGYIEQAPGDVVDLNVTPSQTSLSVQWQPSLCYCPVNSYTIEYILTNRDQCEPINIGPKMTYNGDIPTGPNMLITIDNVLPHSSYEVSVYASNIFGTGSKTSRIIRTLESEPTGAPEDIKAQNSPNSGITFSWSAPSCGERNGIIIGYTYMLVESCSLFNSAESQSISGTGVTFQNRAPFTEYSFIISAGNSAGNGPETTVKHRISEREPSGVPSDLRIIYTSNSSVTFAWSEPPCDERNGIITGYTYLLVESGRLDSLAEYQTTSETNVTLLNLAPFTEYVFVISANTVAGSGPNTTYEHQTLEGIPSVPTLLAMVDTDGGPITIEWSAPANPNGNIINYVIRYWKSGESSTQAEEQMTKDSALPLMLTIIDLDEGVDYNIQIQAVTKAGGGPWSEPITVFVPGGGQRFPVEAVASSLAVIIILVILLLVFILIMRRRTKTSDPPKVQPLKTKLAPESTKEESIYENQTTFQIGDQLYPDISNQEKDTSVNVKTVLVPVPDSEVKPDTVPTPLKSEPPASDVKSRQGTPPSIQKPLQSVSTESLDTQHNGVESNGQKIAMTDETKIPGLQIREESKPNPGKLKNVNIENLSEYIAKQRANRSEGFRADFNDIPYGQQHPWVESQKAHNLQKNRYKNIAAYDHSRVVLEELKGVPNSDYINASYVKGYRDKMYIASQGPNKASVGAIWRMAWEQKSNKIVMLTNLVEGGKKKCEKYWTDTKEPFICPPMTLRHKKTQKYADFVVRDFVLEKEGLEEPWEIRQFHFISWPDMGLPEYPTPLINFLRIVNTYNPVGSGPPIIHCSAGVGRTGTFITVDMMLDMADAEGTIDVSGAVRNLREDRIKMVQTLDQYEFIYDTIQEALLCGDTAVLVTNLRARFSDLLTTINKSTGNTRIVDQFELLNCLTYVPTEEECSSAYGLENVDKNRFPDRVPSDRNRPYLTTTGAEGSTNYINAAFLDSYLMKGEYIVTQMPLPHTIEDFWRMVYENKSTSIVMLNGMSHSDPSLGTYWIDSGTLQFTYLTVEFQSTTKYMDEVIGRTFKIYPSDNPEDYVTVQQFQFLDWPIGQDTPNSTAPLIALIVLMQKWQKKQQHIVGKRPITVHCIDGIGVSGVFCAIICMINRMEAQKIVDVFQSVKRLRMCRPGMVETLEQYKFLHKAAQVHLEEFEIYANFAETNGDSHQSNLGASEIYETVH